MDARYSLLKLAVMPELDLEAKRLADAAKAFPAPRGFRARMASRLAGLALRLDPETARLRLSQN